MKQKITALIALILIVNLSYGQTQLIEADLLKINNMPLASSLDSLVMINSTNKLTYLPKSSLVTPPQTLSFSAGQLTISGANTVSFDTRYYSQSEIDAAYLPFAGGALTGGLVIDENATTTNIAESVFTVKKESTLNATNVGQFIDVDRLASSTPVDLNNNTIGLVSRVTNNSLFNDAGIIGGNFVSRHSGINDFNFAYGSKNTAEYDGSGNGNFLIGNSTESRVTGTGVGIIDYNRGMSSNALINNPNATVNFLQGYHNTIDLSQGTVGSATVSYLDIDGVGATVTGDLAYIRAGNDPLPTVNGNSYFIKSETTLPSEFAGDITAPNFVGNGSQLNNVAKLNSENDFTENQVFNKNIGLGVYPIDGGSASRWITLDGTTTYSGGAIFSLNGISKGAIFSSGGNLAFQAGASEGVSIETNNIRRYVIDKDGNHDFINGDATFGGNVTSSSFIKVGATNNDVLLGDGTTTTKASLSGLPTGFYEEGTFTPTLTDAGGGATYTSSINLANYIREGNKVFFTIKFGTINTTGTPSGQVNINGMPFVYELGIESFNVTEKNSDKPNIFIVGLPTGTNKIVFNRKTSSTTNYTSYSSVTYTSGELIVTGTYITNVYTP